MLRNVRLFCRQSTPNLFRRMRHAENSSTSAVSRKISLGKDSKVSSVYNFPALSKALPWSPQMKYAEIDANRYETKTTTLDNGFRIASEKLFGDFCTVGVIISAGSRFERNYLSGTSHFLEKLAFMSTKKYESREQIIDLLYKTSAICDCQISKDIIIYALSCRINALERAVELLSETIFHPSLLPDEIETARAAVYNEVDEITNRRYDPTPLLTDKIHQAGYGNTTLGLPKYTPLQNINQIDTSMLKSYMKEFYRPERMVLAGVGVDHEQLVDVGKRYFSVPKSDDKIIGEQNNQENKAVWTGGVIMDERDLSHLSFGTDPLPEIVHIMLGFEAPSHQQEYEFVSACLLNQLLGGGGSFSAGGPGKGLYSRFYVNVLNRHEAIKTAVSYNQAYSDSGCLYFHLAGEPSYLRKMIDAGIREIGDLVSRPPESTELQRAKAQLQSMLMMNLEQRPVIFEDVARQVLTAGKRRQADYYFDRINSIQAEDVYQMARQIFSKPLALAGFGKGVSEIRSYDQIAETIQRQLSPKTRWRIFG